MPTIDPNFTPILTTIPNQDLTLKQPITFVRYNIWATQKIDPKTMVGSSFPDQTNRGKRGRTQTHETHSICYQT